MDFKLLITSALYPENQFDNTLEKIYPELNCYDRENVNCFFDNLTKNIKVHVSISDWKLLFMIYLGGALGTGEIQIYKRGFTYPNDKEKEISIRIDLPTSDETKWGIIDKRRYDSYAKRKNDTGFTIIPVDYSQYENMKDYIEDSIKIALKQVLSDGISLKGQKVMI